MIYKRRMNGGSMKGVNGVKSSLKFKALLLKINFFKSIRLLELTVHCASTLFLMILTDPKLKTIFKAQIL